MLGQLFSKGASFLPLGGSQASSRPATSLESVHEDIHTRNLLFPDAETLYQHQHDQVFPLEPSTGPHLSTSTNVFDLNPEIDLELKDVRVVVMQETTPTQPAAALLYDSHALVEIPTSPVSSPPQALGVGTGRSITSPRKSSLSHSSKPVVITQDNAQRPFGGAFDRRASSHMRQASIVETEGQRSMREYREETNTFSNCIFGSSDIMAYKGIGTKVHIIPTESRSSPYPFDGHGSLGRSSARSSKLAQSYTSESITSPTSAGIPGATSGIRVIEKKRVLITRIFPVTLPNAEADDVAAHSDAQHAENGPDSYMFPDVTQESFQRKKPKQKRTPMYAIGLIVQLPATATLPSAPNAKPGFRPSSCTDQESYPSSYNSLKPSGWTVLGMESMESSYSDIDDRIDTITQHWDIIMRTLSRLQAAVSETILNLLKQADLASPSPIKPAKVPVKVASASVSISGKRVETFFTPQKLAGTNAKLVQLYPDALTHNPKVKLEVDVARQRVVQGIKSQQVVTRQSRWGIWREEARLVAKWAGHKEEGFFFFNLLTAFLGVHTEWLQALGPTNYRRHHYQQQRILKDDDVAIAARTVIVGNDKMAARRLLFLLSAFLPPSQPRQNSLTRVHHRSTSTSYAGGAYSQSPPSYFTGHAITREESLRRKVKKKQAHGRNGHVRTLSIPHTQSGHEHHYHSRRDSDAISVSHLRTSNLPISIPGTDGSMHNSSAASTTAVLPATTIPHFSTRRTLRAAGNLRPGSSSSLATDDLMRSLKRCDSSGHYSNVSSGDSPLKSGWGSMISTLWTNKRRGSTNDTDITIPSLSDGGDARSPKSATNPLITTSPAKKLTSSKLAEMVEEVQRQDLESTTLKKSHEEDRRPTIVSYSIPEVPVPGAKSAEAAPLEGSEVATSASPAKSIILGIDADGCIDIDVPLPPYLSFGSPFSSPSSSGYLSGAGAGPETFEQYSGPADDLPTNNVAGWLPRYHSDFALQAIPMPAVSEGKGKDKEKDKLEEEIKLSMTYEPTPPIGPWAEGESKRWVLVATTLIADTNIWSVKRIKYRRLLAPVTSLETPNSTSPLAHDLDLSGVRRRESDAHSIYGNPYEFSFHRDDLPSGGKSHHNPPFKVLEEGWEYDSCLCVDETLTSAVEEIVAWPDTSPSLSAAAGTDKDKSISTAPQSQVQSRVHSRAHSKAGSVFLSESAASSSAIAPGLDSTASEGISKSRDESRHREGSDSTAVPIPTPKRGSDSTEVAVLTTAAEGVDAAASGSLEVPLETSRGEVKSIVLGALEKVAREVAEGREVDGEVDRQQSGRLEKENFLRAGVRGWLEGVERW